MTLVLTEPQYVASVRSPTSAYCTLHGAQSGLPLNTPPALRPPTGPHSGRTGDSHGPTIEKPKPYVTDGGQSAGVPFTLQCGPLDSEID